MEENRIPKIVLYINLESTRPRGRPRNRWQDEVRVDGRIAGGEGWQEKVCNREEWKMLLRTASNRRILHTPMEFMNDESYGTTVVYAVRRGPKCRYATHTCTEVNSRNHCCRGKAILIKYYECKSVSLP
jgi:hypothetical protein